MNARRALIAVAALLLTLGANAATRGNAAPEVLIRNATVLTITNGVIEHGSVLIRGSKIAAVGPADEVSAGPDATVIDATGRYVMPGIIDEHSHTAIEGSVNEFAVPVSAMVRMADAMTNEDISVYRQLAGGTTTAHVLHGSANSIGGQNAVVKWKWGRPLSEWFIPGAPRSIKFALGENPKRSNFRRPGPPRYPGSRMGVEEQIRTTFRDAKDYKAAWDAYRAARKRGENPIPPRRDLLLEEIADILAGEVYIHSHCYRADEILMLMNLGDELGFKVRSFQHVLEGYKVADEMAAHGVGGSTFIDWWGFKFEAYDATPYNVAIMTRRGVNVSINSDDDELARRLNLDAAKAMKYGGLSEEEALKLCTINPAIQLGIDDRIGSIEVGKDADLVIWTGDPLSTYSRVQTTMIEGQVYFDRDRDLARRNEITTEKKALLDREAAESGKKETDSANDAGEKGPDEKPAEPGFDAEVNR